jgi:hypothetical protein
MDDDDRKEFTEGLLEMQRQFLIPLMAALITAGGASPDYALARANEIVIKANPE